MPTLRLSVVAAALAGRENAPLLRPPSCGAAPGRKELSEPEQPSLVQMLRELSLSGSGELFFMQLPDCMPGKAPGQKPDAAGRPVRKEGKPGDKSPSHLQAQVS